MNSRRPNHVKLHGIPHSALDEIYQLGGKAEQINRRPGAVGILSIGHERFHKSGLFGSQTKPEWRALHLYLCESFTIEQAVSVFALLRLLRAHINMIVHVVRDFVLSRLSVDTLHDIARKRVGKPKSDQLPAIMAEHPIVDTFLVIPREVVSKLESVTPGRGLQSLRYGETYPFRQSTALP